MTRSRGRCSNSAAFSCFTLVFLLSGCMSLPDLPNFDENATSEMKTISSKNNLSLSVLRAELDNQQEEIDEIRETVQEMVPHVSSLLELEEDLFVFLDAVSRENAATTERQAQQTEMKSTFESEQQEIDTKATEVLVSQSSKTESTETEPERAQTVVANKLQSNLLADSAPAIKTTLLQEDPIQESNMDSKFSNVNVTETVDQLKGREENQTNTSTARTLNVTGDQFAVHLSSYNSPEQLKSGWLSMRQIYPEITYQKTPLRYTVNVNNKTFYSLRIGPYQRDAASLICDTVKLRGEYCGVVNYQGESL